MVLWVGACGSLRPGAQNQPAAATDSYTEGKKLYDAGDFDGAEAALRKRSPQRVACAGARFIGGPLRQGRTAPRTPSGSWKAWSTSTPANAQAYADLARLYQAQGMFEQALASALEAVKLSPGRGTALQAFGERVPRQGGLRLRHPQL
jgi:tetratricopeptide (TPR) repeat protein